MGLYLPNGFLNFNWIVEQRQPFNFIVGGRGTGKTYGALDYVTSCQRRFIFMRRTQSQLDIISNPEFSPFKTLNTDKHLNIKSQTITKYNSGFYNMEANDDGREVPAGPLLGYSAALSTFANLRGFDGSDVDIIIYDEFIPEKHERPIRNEGAALFNAYETVNRNRELQGRQPVQLFALANSNDLGNAVFTELNVIAKAETMRRKGQELSIDAKRGILLAILSDSQISQAKADTALYRATAGTDFSEMALENTFEELKSRSVKSKPLAEYKAVVTVGELTIYKHKAFNKYYVSTHRTGSCPEYGSSETERARFMRAYFWIWEAYMRDDITFENAACEVLLTKYIK